MSKTNITDFMASCRCQRDLGMEKVSGIAMGNYHPARLFTRRPSRLVPDLLPRFRRGNLPDASETISYPSSAYR
jgi:hypothetical protein